MEAQRRACLAFNPDIVDTIANDVFYFDSIKGASYFDPRDNVVRENLPGFIPKTICIVTIGGNSIDYYFLCDNNCKNIKFPKRV